MKTRRLRLVRPKWTLGTMLLIVGWSAVVVWLNVRPHPPYPRSDGPSPAVGLWVFQYGCPWKYGTQITAVNSGHPVRFRLDDLVIADYWRLAGNIAIGLLSVAVLTFASKYLVRAITAGLRGFVGKPPPGKGNGPSSNAHEITSSLLVQQEAAPTNDVLYRSCEV